MTIRSPFWLVIAAIALCACTASTATNETLNLQSEELLRAFTERLDDADLWYEITSPKSLEVRAEDYDAAVQLLHQTAQEFLPGEALSYASKECQELFKTELERAGISYKTRMHDGSEWVIWQEQDADQVEPILEEASLGTCN